MNSLVFEEVFCKMDNCFRAQNKKILPLVDNAPSHFNSHSPALETDQDKEDENESFTTGKIYFYCFL